jgi:3-methylfumaryl-CoA hydratase
MRRMFAGGRITGMAPLRSGAAATRETSVVGSVVKQGRSGPLTFVTVAHRISQAGRLVIAEEQDIVYRPRSAPAVRAPAPGTVVPAGQRFVYRLDVSATLLFRFSALTYNAHRIHYDRDYVRDVEGYPGLLVHGPLQVLAMAGGIARAGGDLSTVRFEYSLTAPLFDGEGLNVFVGRGPAGWTASVRADDGRPTATATATAA